MRRIIFHSIKRRTVSQLKNKVIAITQPRWTLVWVKIVSVSRLSWKVVAVIWLWRCLRTLISILREANISPFETFHRTSWQNGNVFKHMKAMYCVLFLSWTPTGFLDLSGKEDHVSCPAGRSEIVTLFPCGRKYWFQTIPRGLFPLVRARQYLIYRQLGSRVTHYLIEWQNRCTGLYSSFLFLFFNLTQHHNALSAST